MRGYIAINEVVDFCQAVPERRVLVLESSQEKRDDIKRMLELRALVFDQGITVSYMEIRLSNGSTIIFGFNDTPHKYMMIEISGYSGNPGDMAEMLELRVRLLV